jgi:hypothetical protein
VWIQPIDPGMMGGWAPHQARDDRPTPTHSPLILEHLKVLWLSGRPQFFLRDKISYVVLYLIHIQEVLQRIPPWFAQGRNADLLAQNRIVPTGGQHDSRRNFYIAPRFQNRFLESHPRHVMPHTPRQRRGRKRRKNDPISIVQRRKQGIPATDATPAKSPFLKNHLAFTASISAFCARACTIGPATTASPTPSLE